MKYTENVKNSLSKVGQIEANGALKAYWPERTGNTAQRGILMKDTRWIIPSFLDILDKIHAVHQGICRYRETSREWWWPDLDNQIEDIIKICPTCCKHRKNHAEPMNATALPEGPWQKVVTDLFTIFKIWIPDNKTLEVVVRRSQAPRSVVVNTENSLLRRNKRDLVPSPRANAEGTSNTQLEGITLAHKYA